MVLAFREKTKILAKENDRLRRQLLNVGIKVDEDQSFGGSSSTGVVGSNLIDDEATGKYDEG
ncbi:hypothetical protein COLO4_28146 [Corchorus olitorius]|uniref:Uncharacterized protein n=1 Tax=Corchorus olitorius TaxID=93759 RepID=A0A1R3HMN8_9ROSI|nr:hypothetical protein COLO4_28146 [Corchorus olitorius]